jgi:short-subunit dehydrogenase
MPSAGDGIAVVTGATSGIGAELASELARRGYPLLLVARAAERLDEARSRLSALSASPVQVRVCDLTDDQQRALLLAELQQQNVSILCNNAGAGSFGRFVELDPVKLRNDVILDVLTVHDLCRAVLPGMVRADRGGILITGSLAGNQPVPGSATYAAGKAFVNSLAESLFGELAGTGVVCTLLAPGPVRSNFARRAGVQTAADHLPDPLWVDARQAALVGLAGLNRQRRRVVPGGSGRLLDLAGRLSPRAVLLPVLNRAINRYAVGGAEA